MPSNPDIDVAAAACLGWDIGGAHLKLAQLDASGRLLSAAQHATPLWEGLDELDRLLGRVAVEVGTASPQHGLTMTGELVDLFPDRAHGVRRLLELFETRFPRQSIGVYTVDGRLLPLPEARRAWSRVASANWHATAAFAARRLGTGWLVDIGSTTTDLVPFRDGRLLHRGESDWERLRCDELVYTGVVRTPLLALAARVPYAGAWQNVAADYFATTADVYRISGELAAADDMLAAADRGGKSRADSLRRLGRMLGLDAGSDPGQMRELELLAQHFAACQFALIRDAAARLAASLPRELDRSPIVGAGCGRFLARRLAAELGRRYLDFSELCEGAAVQAALCATAVSVAMLARETMPA